MEASNLVQFSNLHCLSDVVGTIEHGAGYPTFEISAVRMRGAGGKWLKISIQELPAAGHQIRWWEGKEASEWMADIIRPRSSVFLPSAFRLLAPPDRSSCFIHGPLLKRRRPTNNASA